MFPDLVYCAAAALLGNIHHTVLSVRWIINQHHSAKEEHHSFLLHLILSKSKSIMTGDDMINSKLYIYILPLGSYGFVSSSFSRPCVLAQVNSVSEVGELLSASRSFSEPTKIIDG